MSADALPYVDEHTTFVAADADTVWRAVTETLDASFASRHASLYARMVGCTPRTASGPRPYAEGSTLPGFRVTESVPGRTLTLRGAHRFSAYALILRLEATEEGHHLHAETRAAFPGPAGTLYRHLAITSGAHARGMHRLLSGVRRRAGRHSV